jgi:ABC-type sugar transport system ATPase subunit
MNSNAGEPAMTWLGVRGVSKRYGSLLALEDVTLAASRGHIHALLGANGSGKSTLIKLLSGVEAPDSGRVILSGQEFSQVSLASARAGGLRIVHQHSPLIGSQTVTETVAMTMGYPTTPYGRVRWREARERASAVCASFAIDYAPDTPIAELGPTPRALLALAIALHGAEPARTALILDEATASIPDHEARQYLDRIRTLADQGMAVLIVTHRLGEVLTFADDVSVLSAGQLIASGPASDFDETSLAVAITSGQRSAQPAGTAANPKGRATLSRLWSAAQRTPLAGPGTAAETSLAVERLTGDLVRNLSFSLRAGDILGVIGSPEVGLLELPGLLANTRRRRSGVVRAGPVTVSPRGGPRAAIRAGLVLLPADRSQEGGIAGLRIDENLLMPEYTRYWHRRHQARSVAETAIGEFAVRGGSPGATFGILSGGNQQKVILAKWLLLAPRVLILDDPTQGVDPGSRELIFEVVRAAADEGISILMFTSEPAQLAALCSRVIVLRAGGATELAKSEMTAEALTRLAAA